MIASADSTDFRALEWSALTTRDPHALAVAEPGLALTVAELVAAARRTGAALQSAGVREGDRVLIALTNSARFVVTYLAARLTGAVVVNLPWQARRAIVAVADDVEARTVVIEDDLVGDDPVLRALGARRFSGTAADDGRPPREPEPCDAERVAWLACTSGTTGRPKAAVHTERSWYHQTRCFVDAFGLTERDPVLVASPVGHGVGMLYGVRLALMIGAAAVLVPRWSGAAAAQLVAAHRCAFTAAPAPFVMDLVRHAEEHGDAELASLRFFPSGGAPVPLALLERAETALPATQVSAYFGTSEAGAVTVCPPDASRERRLNSDGRALPGMEIAVEDGQLLVRGRQLAMGYWGRDSHERFRADGWYRTGDRATFDGDGYIRMRGRDTDVILRGGENIAPQEIEEVLAAHRAVRDVAVVGFPDERLGERLAAVVVAQGIDPTVEELRRHCEAAGLAPSLWPEQLHLVDALPRSVIGKVRRELLAEQLAAESAR